MRYVTLLLALLLVGSGAACAYPAPDYARAKRATVRIERVLPTATGVCSGWVIARHAIVTAEHCMGVVVAEGFTIDGRKAVVRKVLKDGNDHVILITDLYWRHSANFGPTPAIGDEVFTLGNPGGQRDILLTGRVAGWAAVYEVPGWGVFEDALLLDSNDWRGCSGAAVFDRHGRVVGVVNAMFPWPNDGWRLTAAFGLKFSAMQLLEAKLATGEA